LVMLPHTMNDGDACDDRSVSARGSRISSRRRSGRSWRSFRCLVSILRGTRLFISFRAWQDAWNDTLDSPTTSFGGDDAHMCAAFYGVFLALKDSSLGT
jgi:hypothetical protein